MTKREQVISGLECAIDENHGDFKNCHSCAYRKDIDHFQYVCDGDRCCADAIELLLPHIITEADFDNADEYGYIPAWVEDKETNELYADCITKVTLRTDGYRYWSDKPTNEQRENTPWENT